MHDHKIGEIVDDGLSLKLDCPFQMTRSGEECEKNEAFGCKIHHKLFDRNYANLR